MCEGVCQFRLFKCSVYGVEFEIQISFALRATIDTNCSVIG